MPEEKKDEPGLQAFEDDSAVERIEMGDNQLKMIIKSVGDGETLVIIRKRK